LPAFKATRAKAAAVMATMDLPEVPIGTGEEEFSSDDDYSDDDIFSIGDNSFIFEDDASSTCGPGS
jgi:hypothetical protein